MSYNLMSVTISISTNVLFVLILRFFIFFGQNCTFYDFILFPFQIIKLMTSQIEGKHSRKNAQCWKKL